MKSWKDVNEALSFAHALVMLHRDDKNLPSFNFNVVRPTLLSAEEADKLWEAFCEPKDDSGYPLPVPEYAKDKHTAAGKKQKRGIEHFYTVGAVVNNLTFLDPWEETVKAWYLALEKTHAENPMGTVKPKSAEIMKKIAQKIKHQKLPEEKSAPLPVKSSRQKLSRKKPPQEELPQENLPQGDLTQQGPKRHKSTDDSTDSTNPNPYNWKEGGNVFFACPAIILS